MKELNIEEKARRYDEAKYIMKEYLESSNAGVIAENTIKKAFPELAESEDERIRKALIRFHKSTIDVDGIKGDDVLAWLEKQGNANKEYWRGYREGKQEILYKYAELERQEQNPQIATSTEAKEALYDKPDNHTYSFEDMYEASKQCYDSKYNKDEYCHEQSFKWGFQEGAEWREQKPAAWSKEDERTIKRIDSLLHAINESEFEDIHNWLKSLKERVQPQPKQEWSKEDEERIKSILSVLDVQTCWDGATGKKGNPYQKEIDWLKSLRPKNGWKPTDKDIFELQCVINNDPYNGFILKALLEQLKKLRGE